MSTEPSSITVRLSASYTIKNVIVAIVCLVLGLWGVWDYVEVIPRQERFFARAEVCRTFNQFAEPIVSGGEMEKDADASAFMTAVINNLVIEGGASVVSEIDGLRAAVDGGGEQAVDKLEGLLANTLLPEAVKRAQEAQGAEDGVKIQTGPTSESTWLVAESAMLGGVRTPVQGDGSASGVLRQGLQLAQIQLGIYGDVEQPSAYDRPMQWMFILCLPFVPYYIWAIVVNRRKRYTLDTDGTLHLPGDVWSSQDITDIDMKRWMKSSKAWVVHTDGRRVLLDDYLFKGIFRIVGELAAAQYPDLWTDEAKKIKVEPPVTSAESNDKV
jgi:hypothetical protein